MSLDNYSVGVGRAYVVSIDYPDETERIAAFSKDGLTEALQLMCYKVTRVSRDDNVFTYDDFVRFLQHLVIAQFSDDVTGLLLVISAHGSEKHIETSDNKFVRYDLIELVVDSIPSLRGKFKWIIYNTYRGSSDVYAQHDGPVDMRSKSAVTEAQRHMEMSMVHINLDLIILREATMGYTAFGHKMLSALCDTVKELSVQFTLNGTPLEQRRVDLLTFLTAVSARYASNSPRSPMRRIGTFESWCVKRIMLHVGVQPQPCSGQCSTSAVEVDPVLSASRERLVTRLKELFGNYEYENLSHAQKSEAYNMHVSIRNLETLDGLLSVARQPRTATTLRTKTPQVVGEGASGSGGDDAPRGVAAE